MKRKSIYKTIIHAGFILSVVLAGELFFSGTARAASRSLNVEAHTKEEIIQYIHSHTGSSEDTLTYAENPVTAAPYSAGTLSDATQQHALAALNEMRYIAGLYHGVTVDSTYIEQAQTGALINYVNKKMSHAPTQPEGMSDEMYQLGYKGVSSGNIISTSAATLPLGMAVIHSWMADEDDGNIDRVGHRRWCLNPTMGKTGFGAVSGSDGTHAVMYAFDKSHSIDSNPTVVWPAQTMPTEYFKGSYPWSISSGTAFSEDVSVKLTRVSDKRVWNFSDAKADGYFNYNQAGYGQYNCLIFRPSGITGYDNRDEYLVQVTENGEITLEYTVSFFDIEEIPEDVTITLSASSGTVDVATDEYYRGKATISLSDSSIPVSKLSVVSSDETVAKAMVGKSGEKIWLYIRGLKDGKAAITISLSKDIYAEYYVTVGTGGEHVHTYETEYTIDEAPSCGKAGSKSRHCTGCGDKTDVTVIPATGQHSYEAAFIIREATCTDKGEMLERCKVCGNTREEEIGTKEHQYDTDYTVDEEATCKTEGSRSRHCKWFDQCGNKTDIVTIPVDSDNHKEELVEVLEVSTCVKAGKGLYKCENCGDVVEKELPLAEHIYSSEWVVEEEAICTKDGRELRHCTTAGCTAVQERIIKARNHQGGKAVCEKRAVCDLCGEEYGEPGVHRPGRWIVDREASYTKEGQRHQECAECHKTLAVEHIAVLTRQTGSSVTVGGVSYTVTANSGSKRTVTYNGRRQGEAAGGAATVRIPDTVGIDGQNFKVTAIASKAFAKDRRLRTVVIGKQITRIGNSAFSGCKKLKKVIIPASVKSIGSRAFYGCKKLNNITIKTKKLTARRVGSKAFKGIAKKAVIKVPKSRAKAYKKLLKSRGVSARAVFKGR